ncbi:hypothetical protein RJT34_20493 [Clitoria ternatea]|uniref:PdxS/SNZ N-terminal domain-containing protein n=1 Tax=Clitoria ternatea TaxID=43366 RepID=A0AAN9ITR0_CLITE
MAEDSTVTLNNTTVVTDTKQNSYYFKPGVTQALRGGAILLFSNPHQAKIAEEAGACAITVSEPSRVRVIHFVELQGSDPRSKIQILDPAQRAILKRKESVSQGLLEPDPPKASSIVDNLQPEEVVDLEEIERLQGLTVLCDGVLDKSDGNKNQETLLVDVNFVETVSFKSKTTEIVLRDELAHQVNSVYEEFNTDVTPLFLATYSGNLTLLQKLLNVGANVNMRLFRGYATTAAVREGHLNILEVLINKGASQVACEEALMEASYLGGARFTELLMQPNMIRPQVGVRLDIKVKLGVWSWDTDTGEEFRVGVGLAEAYPITWCAVEYFESTGAILHMLLSHLSPNILHNRRTLLQHAIICNNEKAVSIVLNSGADAEVVVQTTEETNVHPIHIAARLGSCDILKCLINSVVNWTPKQNPETPR